MNKTVLLTATELGVDVLNTPSKCDPEKRIISCHSEPRDSSPNFKSVRSRTFFNSKGEKINVLWEGDLNIGLPFEAFEEMERVVEDQMNSLNIIISERDHYAKEADTLCKLIKQWRQSPWYVRIWKSLFAENLQHGIKSRNFPS